MQLNLSPETEAWLRAQVDSGQFDSVEAAIDYSVKLTSLRETLLTSMAEPERLSVQDVRANLSSYFTERRATLAKT